MLNSVLQFSTVQAGSPNVIVQIADDDVGLSKVGKVVELISILPAHRSGAENDACEDDQDSEVGSSAVDRLPQLRTSTPPSNCCPPSHHLG